MSDALRTRRAIETVWRVEAPRLVGGLVRLVKSLDRAEDLAHEALLEALEHWPDEGIPQNPGAWLMLTAKRRAIDALRRERKIETKHAAIAQETDHTVFPEDEGEVAGDDVLRLMLVACHPVLSAEARVALTLRLLGGLSTDEIARAFLTPEPTIAQRIVRAKRTLGEAKVPFEVPTGVALRERLASVLEVIYLIFNEGYAATRGDDWLRPALCEDALRLGRVLVGLVPEDAEAHGLVALMELQASRARARVNARGEPILLADQDRRQWDRLLLARGQAALARAESLGAPLGPYTLQAAIAACHGRAATFADTDWHRIVALYDALAELTGSPVVELNRAVAVGMAYGPAEALPLVDGLAAELGEYALFPSVRADLLAKLGRNAEAIVALRRALALTQNERERALLRTRIADLTADPPS